MDRQPAIDLARVAAELGLGQAQVESVTALADDGNTVPFITRYRKERTGNLDEERIRAVLDRVGALRQLAERAATILRLIEGQGRLTPELREAISRADSLKRLEDLYLPFKPKKRTRAALARERGLEPLADQIWNQTLATDDLQAAAAACVAPERDLLTPDDVLKGAADILAERISEDAEIRASARELAWRTGKLTTAATETAAATGQAYRDYFNHSEPAAKIPPHRVLAYNRGERAGALRVKLDWNAAQALGAVTRHLPLLKHRFSGFLTSCAADALDRLIQPSLEREIRRELTERAEQHAVTVFARNLRNLLLQPPLTNRRVLAVDPGFRTGCKLAVLDENGNRVATDVIYVTGSPEKRAAARAKIAEMLNAHDCRLVAIGNGTACRETEELIAEMIAELSPDTQYVIVNEAGASIYSTSSVAREEFPDDDATVRGTISIGRRLQDPLSELVKIEPQHIGVGMYQHDVNSKRLRESLDHVIESCVNFVGVDLNTASASLLGYVSGLNQLTARRVVEWRKEHGPFQTRAQLLEVAGVGQATFTQAAGFLKIRGGAEPLDSTWIHPESYPATRMLLSRAAVPDGDTPLAALALPDPAVPLDLEALARELEIGVPTLRDIIDALARPGRDPRADLPGPIFKKGILKMEDLQPGLELRGTVLNVVDFGAFVDVGLKESGLVHISRLATKYLSSPHDAVSVGDVVTVWVLGVDAERKRVSLSMIPPGAVVEPRGRKPQAPDRKPRAPRQGAKPPAPPAPSENGVAPAAPVAAALSATPISQPQKPEPPPLSTAAKQGEEPLRSFGQLKQLWTERDE